MIKLFILVFFVFLIAAPFIEDTFSVTTVGLRIETVPRDILHIDGAGSFNKTEIATTGTAPEEWEGYRFVEWKVDGVRYEGNPINILMDKGRTAVAYYSDKIAEITIDTVPQVSKTIVDGTVYLPSDLPMEFEWDISTVHTIDTEQIVTIGSSRYIFTGWNDLVEDSLREQTVIEDFELKALYDTEHLVTASSIYGDTAGGGWYKEGMVVTVAIPDPYIEKQSGVRHGFLGWDDGTKNFTSSSFVVTEPVTLEALWEKQFLLSVESSISELDIGSEGWYEKDSYAYLFAPREFESQSDNTLYKFAGWSVSANAEVLGDITTPSFSIKMDSPHSVWANWEKQYAFDIDDPFGLVDAKDYYEEGTYAALQVDTKEIVLQENQVRVVFEGFEGDEDYEPNTKILMDEPKSVQVKGTKQYYLDIKSQFGGTAGSGWYDEGTVAPFRVIDLHSPAGLWQQYLFDGWGGDFVGYSQTASILMDGPKQITVLWKEDSSIGILNMIIIAGALGGGGFFYFKMRKRISGFAHSVTKKKDQPPDDQATSENKTKTDPDVPLLEITARKLEEIQVQAQITNLKTEKEAAVSHISSLKLEQDQLKDKIASLKSEKENSMRNISSLKSEEEQIQAKITILKSEKQAAKGELENYEVKTREVESNLDNLRTELETKQHELYSLRAEGEEKQNEITSIKEKLNSAKSKLAKSEKRDKSKKVIAAASTIIAQMNKKYQDLQKELEMTKSILESKKTEYEKISSDLDKSNTEFNSLDSEKSEVKQEN